MSDLTQEQGQRLQYSHPYTAGPRPASLADVLELVLDKGIVIAGDIKINLLDIEVLTIKLRLLIASVDKAREMGINWWEGDPALSSDGGPGDPSRNRDGSDSGASTKELEARVRELESRLAESTNGGSRRTSRQTRSR